MVTLQNKIKREEEELKEENEVVEDEEEDKVEEEGGEYEYEKVNQGFKGDEEPLLSVNVHQIKTAPSSSSSSSPPIEDKEKV